MHKLQNSYWMGPLLSGGLVFIAICQLHFWLSWVCYVPFFISILRASPGQAFTKGLVLGTVLALVAFGWMVPGAERFTGKSIGYGVVVLLLSVLLLALYHAGIYFGFAWLRQPPKATYAPLVNAVLAAAMVCCGEALLAIATETLPWFGEHAGSGLEANLYSIQPASLFGIHVLSFVVVFVNYLIADCIVQQKYRQLYQPAAVVAAYQLAGFLLLKAVQAPAGSKPFSIAILAENIPPETVWNNETGYGLGMQLIDLNREAAALKPNVMLWSESGIPWTYSSNDGLIAEILRVTGPATHLLGINTAYTDKEYYNSAYCILPDGKAAGRYDKQNLLAFIEKPVSGLIFPFLSSNRITERSDKNHAAPLPTAYGRAGILICNEATIPSAAAAMVRQGAQFICLMSNDGWFNDTYIADDHFYVARLRAVETRKDVVINSNNGYSGLIRASGEIVLMRRDIDPFVETVAVQPNDYTPLSILLPGLFISGCGLIVLAAGVFTIYRTGRRAKMQNT